MAKLRPVFNCMAVALILVLSSALAHSAPETANQPYVSVSGSAQADIASDQASLYVAVITRAAKGPEAGALNAAAMDKLLAALKQKLSAEDRLQTRAYSLSPRYEWDQKAQKQRFVDYEASNQILITTKKLDQVGSLIDLALHNGAESVSGPNWSLSDMAGAQLKIQAEAYAKALDQARNIAQAAGVKLGPVQSIIVEEGGAPPMPRMLAAASLANDSAPTPLEPGVVAVSARVRCTFRLLD